MYSSRHIRSSSILYAVLVFLFAACSLEGDPENLRPNSNTGGSPGSGNNGNETYTVYFDINGGRGSAPAPQTVSVGRSIRLPDASGFYRSDHTFGGWNTNSSGSGTTYNTGSNYTPSGDITLYAIWVQDSTPGTEANPILLSTEHWINGSINSSTQNSEVWYTFDVSSGNTYIVIWNDSEDGDTTKTLDIMVDAFNSNGTLIYSADSGYSYSPTIIASSSGFIKIRVYPRFSGDSGTYAIMYDFY